MRVKLCAHIYTRTCPVYTYTAILPLSEFDPEGMSILFCQTIHWHIYIRR